MYKESHISYESIEKFMTSLSTEERFVFCRLEEYARENHIPIIRRDVADYLRFHLKTHRPHRILEVGTAIGYSALWMAEALNGDCRIDTLELDEQMIEKAKQNLSQSPYGRIVNIISGDALQTLKNLGDSYDFAFIDAAKGYYREFWDLILPKMNSKATILCDNMLIRGLVCLKVEEVPRKHRSQVRKMKEFVDYLFQEERIETILLPIGDGLSLSYVNEFEKI